MLLCISKVMYFMVSTDQHGNSKWIASVLLPFVGLFSITDSKIDYVLAVFLDCKLTSFDFG